MCLESINLCMSLSNKGNLEFLPNLKKEKKEKEKSNIQPFLSKVLWTSIKVVMKQQLVLFLPIKVIMITFTPASSIQERNLEKTSESIPLMNFESL